jgi:hypothetical protein
MVLDKTIIVDWFMPNNFIEAIELLGILVVVPIVWFTKITKRLKKIDELDGGFNTIKNRLNDLIDFLAQNNIINGSQKAVLLKKENR